MAVRLPGVPDLGPVDGANPTRPIDVSGVARGGAAIAEGAQRLGLGVQKLGEGMGELALDMDRWDYAKAHSFLLTGMVDREAVTAADTNYGPDASGKSLPNRHADAVTQLQQQAAAMVRDPRMRERFTLETMPTLQRSLEKATGHAKGLENDANLAWATEQGNKIIDQAIKAPDEETRRALIDSHNELIDGLVARGALKPTAAFAAKQNWAHQYATADLLSRADTDPQGVVNELRSAPGSNSDITSRILKVEGTGKNPSSSATGTGQFIDETWLAMIRKNRPDLAQGRSDADILALRADKQLGRDMTEALLADNEAFLTRRGIDATPGAQYLAHFLGPAGAAAVLKADPNKPVADVLTDAVGAKRAAAMIEANGSVLQGQLAGSVAQWADKKMGGATPGTGSIYDQLRPDVRAQVLAHAENALQKRNVTDLTEFKARVEDTTSEAMRTGTVAKPLTMGDFIASVGADNGPRAYRQYAANLQLGNDVASVARLDPDEQARLLKSYEPKPGTDGFAVASSRHDTLVKAIKAINDEKNADPAGFAIRRLPASGEAYQQFSATLGNPAASPEDRATAARRFASVTLMEQQRAGVPVEQRQVLPAGYAETFNHAISSAADSEDAQKRVGLIAQVQREASMWGDNWPAVMRQIAPNVQPVVRAIAAGADPTAMTRLLSLGKEENPKQLLKEQNETKAKDLNSALNTEMAPFLRTLVGRQKDRDFTGYFNLAEKLGALYVRDGNDAPAAARKAFGDLIGNRYEFRDTWRLPKSAGATADDVQAGTVAVRETIRQGASSTTGAPAGSPTGLIEAGNIDLANRPTVRNADGKISTVRSISYNVDGKETLMPTVSDDGRILSDEEALAQFRKSGRHLGKFDTPDNATAYAKSLHEAQAAKYAPGPFGIKPAVNDIALADPRSDSLSKFARDGVFVTSPDNSGLNLTYGDKFVRTADGKPLLFTWSDLARRGGTPENRAKALKATTEFAPGQTP